MSDAEKNKTVTLSSNNDVEKFVRDVLFTAFTQLSSKEIKKITGKENIELEDIIIATTQKIISQMDHPNNQNDSAKLNELINNKILPNLYSLINNNALPVLHGRATDAIASMAGKKPEKNILNNTGSLSAGEVNLVLNQFTELTGTLGVSTHKLLMRAIAEFTKNNNIGTKKRDLRGLCITIPLKKFAEDCGYEVIPHLTPEQTPEEAEKETKRARKQLDKIREKTKKDLQLLTACSLKWEEKVRGKKGDFDIANILGRGAIKNGNIEIEFTLSMGEYLLQLPITQYPTALLRIDERNTKAYAMGLKMANHYSNYNNQLKGTANLLRVKNLISVSNFPSIETVKKNRNRWEDRIKEPFENALDLLTSSGVIKDWRYSNKKGQELNDEKAMNFNSYEEWSETLLYFELNENTEYTQAKITEK